LTSLPHPATADAVQSSAASPSRLVWSITLPAMLTNVATALFGLADMWVIGRLGDAPAQGAVELGAKFMMGLLIAFNFLRTSTIALTAQSAGRGDGGEQAAILARGLAAALLIGVLLLLVRPLAVGSGLALLEAEGTVAFNARIYIDIRYWAGTAWLINCVLVGWLIGQRRVRTVLAVEIVANAAHIALDLALVLLAGWGVAGVAVATVSSELLKLLVLAIVVGFEPAARQAAASIRQRATWDGVALRLLFSLNRDLFLRTLLLTAAMLILARGGAQQGPVILAANGILFQVFMLATLILDGFESAAQVLCGEAKGAGDRARFVSVLRLALLWGCLTGAAISLGYLVAGEKLAASFSTDAEVAATAISYLGWVALLPILGVVSFVLDGVFVGAAWTRAMLVTMAVAMAVYGALLYLTAPLGNDGLWLAFSIFFVIRAGGQLYLLPGLIRRDLGRVNPAG
jgi:MATE family multidrug resistance protein